MPKVIMEGLGAVSVSALSLVVGTPELALFVTVMLAVLGGMVWAIRLEGRVNSVVQSQTEVMRRLDRIADHLNVPD